MDGCAGTVPFRAFWERPKRADEWEAEVKPEYGASNLSLSSIEYIGDGFHELTGTVHVRDGEFSVVSIRVRGRFGDDGWGAWSRPTELFCVPPPPPRTLADGVKVTSSPASGDTYGPGETIEITVEFSSAVVVVGDPEFEFCMGDDECRTGADPPARRRAAYSSGSGDTELVFSYVVGSDDDPDDDGNGISIGDGTRTLQLDSDDRIQSAETDDDAEIEHNALGDQSDHKVNAVADIDEIAVTSSPASGDTYDTGETIEITVTFDLAVNVTGDPQFGISAGGQKLASFTGDSGTTELVFGYTVQFGDEDDNGIWIGSHDHDSNPTFRLDSDDAITGAATGHDADLAHDVIGQQNGHKVDGATAPQGEAGHGEPQEDDEISALTASFEDGPGGHDGESAFTLRIAFSEAVAIDAPSVGVINGSVTEVRRVDGRDDLWEITVVPASNGVVFVSLLQPPTCGETGAICTADGRPLSVSISTAVRGPDEGPEPNTPATGAPAIGGTPRVDETLSASTSGISDADGLDDALFAYQWIRTDTDISGATGSTYTAVEADEGERLKVRVSFADDAGNAESVTSAATDAVAARPAPLTASFEGVPAEHDGESAFTLRIASSDRLSMMNGRRLREDVVAVTGGRATSAGRVDRRRDLWRLRVEPDSPADVTVTVAAGAACGTPAAVCTKDGRALSNTISATVRGPVGIAVADAHVEEDAGAVLAFAVTLSRAASRALTVDYATSDGSAQAGVDYTASSGTLTFQAGESSRTIEVGVLDDAHDEGEETLTLRLSNASGGLLTDGEATGTIENSDPLPRALLARFGRTAAVHVVEHVEERLEAPREPGFRGRFAGRELRRGMERDMALNFLRQLGGAAGVHPAGMGGHGPMAGSPAAGAAPLGTPGRGGGALMLGAGGPLAGAAGMAGGGASLQTPGLGVAGFGGAAPLGAGASGGQSGSDGGLNGGRFLHMGLGGGDLLTGSDFAMNRESHGGILSFWSRGAQSRFSGREGDLSLGGDVRTTMFGADYARGPLVAGLSLSNSRGLGEYAGAAGGQVASSVTGLYPWLGYKMTERVTVWGVAGYGTGGLLLTPDSGQALESGLSMAMAAAGTRGDLLAGGAGGFALAFKADALWVGTSIDGVDGPAGRLKATAAAVTRIRTGLEGSRAYTLAGRLSLKPSVEVGLRHDGGDAETGAGMDVGAGLVMSDAGDRAGGGRAGADAAGAPGRRVPGAGRGAVVELQPDAVVAAGLRGAGGAVVGRAGDERGRGAVGPRDDGGHGARRRRLGQPPRWRDRLRAAGGQPLRRHAAGRLQHVRARAGLPGRLRSRVAEPREPELRAGHRRAAPRESAAGGRKQRRRRPGHGALVDEVRTACAASSLRALRTSGDALQQFRMGHVVHSHVRRFLHGPLAVWQLHVSRFRTLVRVRQRPHVPPPRRGREAPGAGITLETPRPVAEDVLQSSDSRQAASRWSSVPGAGVVVGGRGACSNRSAQKRSTSRSGGLTAIQV